MQGFKNWSHWALLREWAAQSFSRKCVQHHKTPPLLLIARLKLEFMDSVYFFSRKARIRIDGGIIGTF